MEAKPPGHHLIARLACVFLGIACSDCGFGVALAFGSFLDQFHLTRCGLIALLNRFLWCHNSHRVSLLARFGRDHNSLAVEHAGGTYSRLGGKFVYTADFDVLPTNNSTISGFALSGRSRPSRRHLPDTRLQCRGSRNAISISRRENLDAPSVKCLKKSS
jgi:hypothetical protein